LTVGETAREPEKLLLPPGAVQYLLGLALQTQLGDAWWRGFVCAHGEPSWLLVGPAGERRWAIKAQEAHLVRAAEGEA
jgi:hypothetical protein